MASSGTFSSYNLLEDYSWSSSSSTPGYSPHASFVSPNEASLNFSPKKLSVPLANAAAAGSSATGATTGAHVTTSPIAGLRCSSEPDEGSVASPDGPPLSSPTELRFQTAAEEDVAAAPDTPRKEESTSKTTCSSAPTKRLFDICAARAMTAAPAGHAAAASSMQPAAIVGKCAPAAATAVRGTRASTLTLPGPADCDAPTSVTACCLSTSKESSPLSEAARPSGERVGSREGKCDDVDDKEEEQVGGGSEGRFIWEERLPGFLVAFRDGPARDAAFSGVCCGCYIFWLATCIRFFFLCSADAEAPLPARKSHRPAAPGPTHSFLPSESHFAGAAISEMSPFSCSRSIRVSSVSPAVAPGRGGQEINEVFVTASSPAAAAPSSTPLKVHHSLTSFHAYRAPAATFPSSTPPAKADPVASPPSPFPATASL